MSNTHSAIDQRPKPTLVQQWRDAWNAFWFRPGPSETLAVMRILTGLMVLYSHAVWTIEFSGFIGGQLLPPSYRADLYKDSIEASFAWSHFDWLPETLWLPTHIIGLLAVIFFIVGWQTRIFGWVTAALVISYANRATGVLFGLDQILALLTLYLAISKCGDAWSIDRRIQSRMIRVNVTLDRDSQNDSGSDSDRQLSPRNTIATRLIQIHLCVVYLFAGLGKCQGDTWWNGEAIWGALASYEYQTVDMTFMANQMTLVAIITLLTLAWEVGYAALIWPKLTRPIMLALAIPMHLGIGLCMGMMTFGLVMLVANMAFISPDWFRRSMPPVQSTDR